MKTPIEFNGAVSVVYDEHGRAHHRPEGWRKSGLPNLLLNQRKGREFSPYACLPGRNGKCTVCGTGDCEKRG